MSGPIADWLVGGISIGIGAVMLLAALLNWEPTFRLKKIHWVETRWGRNPTRIALIVLGAGLIILGIAIGRGFAPNATPRSHRHAAPDDRQWARRNNRLPRKSRTAVRIVKPMATHPSCCMDHSTRRNRKSCESGNPSNGSANDMRQTGFQIQGRRRSFVLHRRAAAASTSDLNRRQIIHRRGMRA